MAEFEVHHAQGGLRHLVARIFPANDSDDLAVHIEG